MYWKMVINFNTQSMLHLFEPLLDLFVVSASFHCDECIYYESASSMKINSCW